jgi:hypothetical protein
MADERYRGENEKYDDWQGNVYKPQRDVNNDFDFMEETSAEITAPYRDNANRADNRATEDATEGRGIGWLALTLSIISLFVLPVLLGAAGIILGFIARRRGAEGLGAWAIGIGVVSIIVGVFILPFF